MNLPGVSNEAIGVQVHTGRLRILRELAGIKGVNDWIFLTTGAGVEPDDWKQVSSHSHASICKGEFARWQDTYNWLVRPGIPGRFRWRMLERPPS